MNGPEDIRRNSVTVPDCSRMTRAGWLLKSASSSPIGDADVADRESLLTSALMGHSLFLSPADATDLKQLVDWHVG